MIRKGQHVTVAQAIAIFDKCPDAVLTRSGGWGWFDMGVSRKAGVTSASQLTYRTCEALVKRNVIKLRDASSSAGYWVKF